jgi:hypothetical protein
LAGKKIGRKKNTSRDLGFRTSFKVAIIHKTIHPDLAIQKHETKFSLKALNFGCISKLEEIF